MMLRFLRYWRLLCDNGTAFLWALRVVIGTALTGDPHYGRRLGK